MKCFSCGSSMVRGVCRCCGRVARRSRGRPSGKIVSCGKCEGSGTVYTWGGLGNYTCNVCGGKGKVRV